LSESFDIIEVSPIKRNKPSVITGFAGAGFVGNTALSHIIRAKGYKLKSQLRSHLIPAMILLEDGRPVYPFRIYGDEKGELLFVTSAVLITPENAWTIGLKLVEYLKKFGVGEYVAVEGMPLGITMETRPVYGFTVPERDLSQYGVSTIRDAGVSGLNAVMLEEALKQRLPWTALLIPTPFASAIDYGAAIPIVKVLDKMFELGVDVEDLERRVEMIRKTTGRGRRGGGFLGSLFGRRPSDSGDAGA
jgi:predicted ATP-grasp superfamily ATP-dependent carboligase